MHIANFNFNILMRLLINGAGKIESTTPLTESEMAAQRVESMLSSDGAKMLTFITQNLHGDPKKTFTDTVFHDSDDLKDGKNRWWIR